MGGPYRTNAPPPPAGPRPSFIKKGINPFTKEPLDMLDADAFARPRPLQRSSFLLSVEESARESETRLGGVPRLPVGVEWPARCEIPLPFLGQFDLGELGKSEVALAAPGPCVLAVFGDHGPSVMDELRFAVIATPTDAPSRLVPPPSEDLVRPALALRATAFVDTEARQGGPKRGPRHKFGGFADWLQVDARMAAFFDGCMPHKDPEVVELLRGAGIDPDVIRGGWRSAGPEPRNELWVIRQLEARGIDPAILGRGSEDFELLLQIDSDERAGLQWADVGRFYVFAKQSDVRARRFDRVVAWCDSY
jgi:hypothetical protein